MTFINDDQISALQGRDDSVPPNKREVDAMWALLQLVQRSPEADIVLISAMVKNGDDVKIWLENLTGRSTVILDLSWKPTRQLRGALAYSTL